MKSRSLLVCLLLAVPVLAPAANKEIEALQRDIALLQQQIKDLYHKMRSSRPFLRPRGAADVPTRLPRGCDHQQH
jgi:hypothetical protein